MLPSKVATQMDLILSLEVMVALTFGSVVDLAMEVADPPMEINQSVNCVENMATLLGIITIDAILTFKSLNPCLHYIVKLLKPISQLLYHRPHIGPKHWLQLHQLSILFGTLARVPHIA